MRHPEGPKFPGYRLPTSNWAVVLFIGLGLRKKRIGGMANRRKTIVLRREGGHPFIIRGTIHPLEQGATQYCEKKASFPAGYIFPPWGGKGKKSGFFVPIRFCSERVTAMFRFSTSSLPTSSRWGELALTLPPKRRF